MAVSLTNGLNPYLLWLDRGLAPRALVGGKGASLSQLIALGAPVPSAFALTTHAYREFAHRLSLPTQAFGIDDSDLPRIRAEIESAPLKPQMVDLLVSGLRAFELESD